MNRFSLSSPIVFFGLVACIVVMVVFLPAALAQFIFPLILLGSLALGLGILFWDYGGRLPLHLLLADEAPPPEAILPQWWVKLRPLIYVLEWLLIAYVALLATRPFWEADSSTVLTGGEVEWLTSSAYFAHQSLVAWGYIPYWQPYFEWGEPLLHNPFAFVLNPLSTLPELLMGGGQGLKLSVSLHVLLVGGGGWVLGRVLNMSSLGRVMLALLLIGKGNLLAMVGTGYFQLGVTQAYFPWIIAATLHLLRTTDRENRWSPMLLALSFTLMFWAGNIWYTLPMLLSIGFLALFHLWDQGRVNVLGLQRLGLAGIFTLGLSMVLFLPIWQERDLIGGHADDLRAGTAVSLSRVIEQYHNGSYETYQQNRAPGEAQFYYSYVAPLWFWILFFILIPPFLNRASTRALWRIWIPALLLVVIHTLWGAGGNRVFVWLYQNVDLLAQWRFVGRALAVSAFWLAVIAALRLDGLVQVILNPILFRKAFPLKPLFLLGFQGVCLLGLVQVGYELNLTALKNWSVWAGTIPKDQWVGDDICLEWLQAHDPDPNLAIYRKDYHEITAFLDYRMRLWNIEADYYPLAQKETLSHPNIMRTLPPYALAWGHDERAALIRFGYRKLEDSPTPVDENPCVWYKADAPRYAFLLEADFDYTDYAPLTAARITPVTTLDRRPDTIWVWLDSASEERVLVLQELAYGHDWRVRVNGERKELEAVGGLIGVKLPPSDAGLVVEFAYRPRYFFIGGYITLLFAVLGMLYLGRVDARFWPKRHRIDANRADLADV